MNPLTRLRALGPSALAALGVATLLASAALAHHGWDWAEDAQTELSGTIVDIYIGPPHPELTVETADDDVWTIELGNPRATERSGFVEGVAEPGDTVTVLGHRSLDHGERLMKAVRITIDGQNYDLYPDLIQE